MLIQHNLSSEDPCFAQALETIALERPREVAGRLRARWNAEGPGPVALTGGVWNNGVVLGPEFRIERASRVSALEWEYPTTKLGEWHDHSDARLLVMDFEAKSSWVVDAKARTKATMIVPAEIELSANCLVVLQLKAGDRVGRIYRPPYIPVIKVGVTYRY